VKHILSVILPVALLAPALAAEGFWHKKKYLEWSQKDVQKMLNDSPWAKPFEFHPPTSGDKEELPGRATCEACSGGNPNRYGTELPETMMIVIRWQSALPVKQAMVKARFGAEAANTPEAAQFLARQEVFYVVGVASLPAQLLPDAPEKLKAKAVLKRKNKPPLAAAQVKSGAIENNLAAVYFAFPRTENGAPAVAVEDGEIEFALELGSNDISRKFRLKDMLFDGKLEL
jgi:hypothetical protein